ncbi:HNH endonuclease [Variovorax paradoxus]|uniref:HNH endonuclease n=1 Tax=Variovorax paradoxus TaxID=34073 RepID=UPI001ABC380C
MLQLLRQWYPIYLTRVVAGALQLTERAVYQKANALGLRKSAEFLASDASRRIQRGHQDPKMISTRFQKGMVPWNKGTHHVAGGRSAETRFRKGNKPQTWLPVGSYRLVPGGSSRKTLVLELKVNDLPGPNHVRWHPVHRLVWIEANGPVPAGHVVVFKPGKRTVVLEEITLDAIELVPRCELMRRNSVHTQYPPEVARLVQLRGALNRQINARARAVEES